MKLIIGIGVPGSGKTSFLKPLAEQLGIVYICPDDIREELTGNAASQSKERAVWATVYDRIAEALKKDDVVIDATFVNKKDRARLIKWARQLGANEIIAYWFKITLKTCLERNSARARVVPEHVIMSMYDKLAKEPPSMSEGFNNIIQMSE